MIWNILFLSITPELVEVITPKSDIVTIGQQTQFLPAAGLGNKMKLKSGLLTFCLLCI